MGLTLGPANKEPAAFESKARKNRQASAGLHPLPCSPFSLLPLLPLGCYSSPSSLPPRPITCDPGCHSGLLSSFNTVEARWAIPDARSALKALWKVLVVRV